MADDDIAYRKLTESDVHATAHVLASAFADNPAYAWMHPRAATRARDLRTFFERNLRWHLPLSLTWVATSGSSIVGTSTLEPPGGVPSAVRQAVAHWLVPTVRDQGLRTFLRINAADGEFRKRYHALTQGNRYYHVHAVAVAPAFQGQGIGSALVATTLHEFERLSAQEPAPALVSTQLERNLPLYQRAGFTLREDHLMGVGLCTRGYRSWFMVKPSAPMSGS
jgi:GNAT superfamily N-acetyltransferase